MGFLANAAMGIGTGVFKQADQDYDDVANERQQMLGQRAKVVDQISQQHDKMEQDAQDTQSRMNSYQTQYNIPSDMAYTLATDPVVKTMKPDEVGDYVRRLKPTGQYMPPDPGKTAGYNAPGQTVNHGVMGGGSYSIPGIQAQPVQNSGFNQPRQIYSQTPPNPKYKDTMGPLPETTCQAVLGQRANLANWDADPNNAGKMPPTSMLQGAWSGGKDHGQDTNHKAFELAFAGLSDGKYGPDGFYTTYKSMGGTPDGLKGFDPNLITGKAHADPALEQRANAIAAGLAQLYHLDPNDPQLMTYSRFMAVPGSIHSSQDQNGQYTGSYQSWSGKPLDAAAADLIKRIKGPDDIANQPIPPGKTSTADIPPPPPNGPKQDVIFTPLSVTGRDKEELARNREVDSQAPKILRALKVFEGKIGNDPNAIGYVGDLQKHLGGLAINTAQPVSPGIAKWIDSFTRQSDKQDLDSASRLLSMTLSKNLVSMFTSGRQGQGGTGGKETAESFDEIFGHNSPTDTSGGLLKTIADMKNTFAENYTTNMMQNWSNTPDLTGPDQRVQANALGNYLIKHVGFSKVDALMITHRLQEKQEGKD